MTNILMVSHPQGNRGPANAYGNHHRAVSKSKKYNIHELSSFSRIEELSHMDVFWFSIRFHPAIYHTLRNAYPGKTFVMGPNVLFEKAEIGPSDEWEKWFVDNVTADFYFNKADFYLDRAKQFYKNSKNYAVLKNCIDLSTYDISTKEKDIDVLLYYKNRRIDNQLDSLFPKFVDLLSKRNLSYKILEYGRHKREDYFSLLERSRLCAWFSIEDFCSNAQLESQFFNVPVLGTKYNLTDSYDDSLVVDAASLSDSEWVRWLPKMPEIYAERIDQFFESEVDNTENKPSDFIKRNFSYEAYEKQLDRIFS